KVFAVTGAGDRVPGRPVHLPALEGSGGGKGGADAGNGGIARLGDDAEDLTMAGRHLGAGERSPGQVAVNRARPIALGPQVDEHKIARANGSIAAWTRRVVRIAAVRVDGADGRMVGYQLVRGEVVEDALL